SGEAVNDTNREWTKQLIKSDAAKCAVHPAEGRGRVAVTVFCSRRMRMPPLVPVGMRMTVAAGKIARDPVHHAGKVQDAEQNQHQADGKFHREAKTRRN